MIVVFYFEGNERPPKQSVPGEGLSLPLVGDRVRPDPFDEAHFIVTERWPPLYDGETAYLVLREPETPAEKTPPWKRGKEGT